MQINQHIIKKINITGKNTEFFKVLPFYFNTVQSVTIIFLLKVGGLYEDELNYGISHFLEHMAFKGTKSLNYLQIAHKFDQIGGNFNAYTSKDRTVFYAKVLKNNVKEAIDLLSEVILQSTLPQSEVEKERNVILQEIFQDEEAYDHHIFDLYYQNAYYGQPIGQNLLGNPKFIRSVSQEQLYDFMSKFYKPSNMVIALSGNFDEIEVVKYIEDKFAKLYNNNKASKVDELYELPKSYYTPKFHHKHAEIEQMHMILGFEGVDYNSDYFYAQNLASMILGEGMSSRLFQKIREQNGLAYNITAFNGSYHDTGTLGVYAASAPEDVYEIIQLIKEEIYELASGNGDLENELRIAKNITLSSILMSMESNAARAEKVASNDLTFGRFITPGEIEQSVNKVSSDDIIAFFKKFVLQSSSTFVSIGNRVEKKVYDILMQ